MVSSPVAPDTGRWSVIVIPSKTSERAVKAPLSSPVIAPDAPGSRVCLVESWSPQSKL